MRVGRANDINGAANLLRNLAILAENQMAAYFSAPFTGDVKFRYKTFGPEALALKTLSSQMGVF